MNRTVGRGLYHIGRVARQSEKFNKFNAATGRVLTGTLDRAAKASFDVRNSAAATALGKAGLGFDAGEGAKGGLTDARARNIKLHEEEAKRIEEAHKEAFRPNSKESQAIIKATQAYEEAQKEKKSAEDQKESAQERIKRFTSEVARLSAVEKADKDAGRPSSVTNSLKGAQQNLADSQKDLTTATSKLSVAATTLAKTDEVKIKAEKEPGERMKKSIEASKIAYAEGIDHLLNPITFLAYGPGTATAARNIKKEAKKPLDQIQLETLQKALKKVSEGTKSEASAASPAPAASSTH